MKSFKRKHKKDNSGMALIEAAITLPILLLILCGSYDLGQALNASVALKRVAYEGARIAATWPNLELRTAPSISSLTNETLFDFMLANNTTANPTAQYDRVKERVRSLISAQRNSFVARNSNPIGENVLIQIERIDTDGTKDNFVRASLMIYHPIQFTILPFMESWFSSIPIRAIHEVPYLR